VYKGMYLYDQTIIISRLTSFDRTTLTDILAFGH